MKTAISSSLLVASFLAFPALCQTPAGFSPATNKTLNIQFGSTFVTPGSKVSLDVPGTSPQVGFPTSSQNTTHLVLMVDLDAPFGDANRTLSPLLHWLQPSISSSVTTLPSNDSSTTAVVPYAGPAPPAGSGPHRYVCLAFAQSAIDFTMPADFAAYNNANRFTFDVSKFVEEAGLGAPVGANWFTVENDTVVQDVQGAAGRVSVSWIGVFVGAVAVAVAL